MIRARLTPTLLTAALGIVLEGSRGAHAADGPKLQIQLALDPCVEVDAAEVRRLLRIELAAELLLPSEPAPDTSPRAAVTCEQEQVRLQIEDPITGKSLSRRLALRAAATATRARLLALALAELLLASWAELSLDSAVPADLPSSLPSPGVRPAELSPATARMAASAQVRKHTPRVSAVHLGVQASLLSFPMEAGATLFGGELRVSGDLRYRLHWQLEMHGHYSTRTLDPGTLSAALFGGALALHYQQTIGAWHLRAGGGGRLAAAWLRGQPEEGSSVRGLNLWAPVAGPLLRCGVARRLPQSLTVEADLEVGYALAAVRGNVDGVRALALEGPWLGMMIGVNRAL